MNGILPLISLSLTDGSAFTVAFPMLSELWCSRLSNDDRNIMTLRLPADQMRRLDKAARSRRQTKQSFVQEFVLAAITDVEENRRLKKDIVVDDKAASFNTPGIQAGGLGLSLRPQVRENTETVPVTPTPVVVQVGGNNSTPTASAASLGDLDRLALFIVKGEDFMRSMRKRTVVEILEMTSASPEECKVLVARVEELVAAKAKVAEQEKVGNKLAHIAFEKLAALIKGD